MSVKLDLKPLKEIQKIIEGSMPQIRIGVRDDKPNSKGLSNAEIGSIHEFGLGVVPQRSFLRMPLALKMNEKINFEGSALKEAFDQGGDIEESLDNVANVLGRMGVQVVHDAFDSGGFGQWPTHSEGYSNNTGMLLQDTMQLRDSIDSEVE